MKYYITYVIYRYDNRNVTSLEGFGSLYDIELENVPSTKKEVTDLVIKLTELINIENKEHYLPNQIKILGWSNMGTNLKECIDKIESNI